MAGTQRQDRNSFEKTDIIHEFYDDKEYDVLFYRKGSGNRRTNQSSEVQELYVAWSEQRVTILGVRDPTEAHNTTKRNTIAYTSEPRI